MADLDLNQELTLLLEREIGFAGKFILEKQCRSLDIDPNRIVASDLESLAEKVTWAIRSYTGDKRAEEIKRGIMEYQGALAVVDSSIDSQQAPDDLIEAEIMISEKKQAVGMRSEARDALDRARSLLGKVQPENRGALDSRISRLMGRSLSASADTLDEAVSEFERAIRTGTISGQHYEIALSWNGIGSISWRIGQHQKALDSYNKALEAIDQFPAQSKNDKSRKQGARALIKSGFGNVYLDLLDYDAAIRFNEEAIEEFRAMGNEAEVGRIYNNLARVYEEMGNYPRAIDRYERAIKFCGDSGSLRMQGWAMTNLASTLVEHQKLEDARSYLEKAEKVLDNFKDPIAHSKLNCMWGKYHREKAQWPNGIERFERSIDLVRDVKAPDYMAIAQEEFGILYLKKGDKSKAREYLHLALEWYKQKNDKVKIPKLEKLLAQVGN